MPSPDIHSLRAESLNIFSPKGHSNGIMPMAGPHPRFDGPRSPPNTFHVPCKFFRQGACQAGQACPFSHDIGAATETVCKYFTKGNCKFGPKCANIHVLPDGRRVNYNKNGLSFSAHSVSLGTRVPVNAAGYQGHPSNSALTNSFLRGAAAGSDAGFAGAYIGLDDDRFTQHNLGRKANVENGLPTVDTATFEPDALSAYGSSRDSVADDAVARLGIGPPPANSHTTSTTHRGGFSVLDAPLPASFDSNGISMAARYGPWPASMPSQLGLDSPTPSLPPSLRTAKETHTNEALRALRLSAWGGTDQLCSPLSVSDSSEIGIYGGTSPIGENNNSSSNAFRQPGYGGSKRMHSSSTRFGKPSLLSSSAPKMIDGDWARDLLFEDFVPSELANEVLTSVEKARRGSFQTLRGTIDSDAGDLNSTCYVASKYSSPLSGASPSRFGEFFQKQKEQGAANMEQNGGGALVFSGRPMMHTPSAFGHVGSPLRTSSLASKLGDMDDISTEMKENRGSYGGGGDSLSVLTQQLQRTRLVENGFLPVSASSSPHLNPMSSAASAVKMTGRSTGCDREQRLDRHFSSGSIGSSVNGRLATAIEEQDPTFVFNMEEDPEDVRAPTASGGGGGSWTIRAKRTSDGFLGVASPLSSAWTGGSFAAAAAGRSSGTEASHPPLEVAELR